VKLGSIEDFGEDSEKEMENSNEGVRKKSKIERTTHGYEGDFQVVDLVKVTKDIRIWSVKPYTDEGFEIKGFTGKVTQLLLYGRKHGTLCSAITPIKVEFEPTGEGIPPGMFTKKFVGHFSHDELELIRR
jgi:hypothetical protein